MKVLQSTLYILKGTVGRVVKQYRKSNKHGNLPEIAHLTMTKKTTRASIHKGTLRKKTDLKTDSFLLLFTDVLFGAFGRLPNFFTNRSFYNNTATHVGVGGGGC